MNLLFTAVVAIGLSSPVTPLPAAAQAGPNVQTGAASANHILVAKSAKGAKAEKAGKAMKSTKVPTSAGAKGPKKSCVGLAKNEKKACMRSLNKGAPKGKKKGWLR
jgi:hypothetical protein